MVKVLLLSTLIFFLSGCWLMYDTRQTPHLMASVKYSYNKVCVSVSPEGDEIISSIYIDDTTHAEKSLSKSNLNIPVYAGQCVPDFGYKFETGRMYHFTTTLVSPLKKKQGKQPYARLFGGSFTLQDFNGKQDVTVHHVFNTTEH